VFFFLSGFLLAYILINSKNAKIDWKLYLHRIIRLYPALLFSYALYVYILPIFGDGPRFYKLIEILNDCPKLAHYIFTFVYNFRPRGHICVDWTWYLANDMQFFIVGVPIVYLLKKYKVIGFITIGVIMVLTYLYSIHNILEHDVYMSLFKQNEDYYLYYYNMPYARIAPYLIGFIFAYFYIETKNEQSGLFKIANKIKENFGIRLTLYIFSITGMFWMIHGIYWINKYPEKYSRNTDLIYLLFRHSVFVILLIIFCIPALLGKGKILHMLFGNKFFEIIAKLTYGVYMTHEAIQDFYQFTMKTAFYASYDTFILWFLSILVLGHFAALFLHVFIELPIFSLEERFLRKRPQNTNLKIEQNIEEKNNLLKITEQQETNKGN